MTAGFSGLPKIFVLNGPNLNLLGQRRPEIYGHQTLEDVKESCEDRAAMLGLEVDFRQTNHEGVLVDHIQEARESAAGIIINPAAYSHTSIAVHDALEAFEGPILEVHLSNIHAREPFRHHSYVSTVAKGVLCGFGSRGYLMALDAMVELVEA